ncbi:MAG TPA: isopentenyl-diphosphate Delta-isomerase [Mucilaginibacter sp.]|jgi:isopentenyl-diphosphate delta-isomerase|nr:isopentenyl-diphosphate Delta-isomerase [Mucilaginibacter sp.]
MERTVVVLVDELDNEIGTMEKMAAHLSPNLHRAFSVFIFNTDGAMLLQQRADGKYHSSGLWTNACCSHPAPGEDVRQSAMKRLQEEMGFTVNIQEAFSFIYQANLTNGLVEYEYDHVFVGTYNGPVAPDPAEVRDFCYKTIEDIEQDIMNDPDAYTEWFKIALPLVKELK